jgi:hypothetical protein
MLLSVVDWLLLMFNNSMLLDSVASDYSTTGVVLPSKSSLNCYNVAKRSVNFASPETTLCVDRRVRSLMQKWSSAL